MSWEGLHCRAAEQLEALAEALRDADVSAIQVHRDLLLEAHADGGSALREAHAKALQDCLSVSPAKLRGRAWWRREEVFRRVVMLACWDLWLGREAVALARLLPEDPDWRSVREDLPQLCGFARAVAPLLPPLPEDLWDEDGYLWR